MKIQTTCKNIGDNGCLAFIYLWCADITESLLISSFEKLVGISALDHDCTVKNASKLLSFFGVTATVDKSWAAPADGSRYAARWTKDGFVHYVGMVNGKVVENTLDYSHCVSEGVIDTTDPENPPYRILTIKKV